MKVDKHACLIQISTDSSTRHIAVDRRDKVPSFMEVQVYLDPSYLLEPLHTEGKQELLIKDPPDGPCSPADLTNPAAAGT